MALQWISVALTVTGTWIWFSGANQGLGYSIFMAGGVMWLILQNAEKKRVTSEKTKSAEPEAASEISRIRTKPKRQSDLTG